jgi:hypothetical protein
LQLLWPNDLGISHGEMMSVMTIGAFEKRAAMWPVANRIVLIMALVMAAHAHRVWANDDAFAVTDRAGYAAQYTLPDGTLPVLCQPGGQRHHAHQYACDFCLIAGAASVPDMADDFFAMAGASPVQRSNLAPLHAGRKLYRIYAALRAPPMRG